MRTPKKPLRPFLSLLYILTGVFFVVGIASFFLPTLISWKHHASPSESIPFPITVDPKNKVITEDPVVESMFLRKNSPLSAAAANGGDFLSVLIEAIDALPVYRFFATANAPRIVIVYSGYRKEQVAQKFTKELLWDTKEEKEFLTFLEQIPPYLLEGTIAPDAYAIPPDTTSAEAASMVRQRFEETILSHYPTSTQNIVPLSEALTIASMIERETADKDEMRVISGIIWNRIFKDMRLQVDSTLQYAKGTGKNWWPKVGSRDKFITSPYNTYINHGLPPSPISNPSVAAVLAALNPKKTDCLFYFHQSRGQFHCSATYAEHVALLKKYYGQGK